MSTTHRAPRRVLHVALLALVAFSCAKPRPHPAKVASRADGQAQTPTSPAPAATLPRAATVVDGDIPVASTATVLGAWAASTGCPWAARDGSEVLCWRQQHHEGGRLTIALQLLRAPGTEVRRYVLYDAGAPGFEPAAVRVSAVASANAWIAARGARRGTSLRTPVKITHNRFTLLWQGVHWGMPLQKPPAIAPTPKLSGREGLCCKWQPADATHFAHCGLVAVRLVLVCDWHRAQRGANDVCFDSQWLAGPSHRGPTHAVHFIPVGGAIP